MKRFLLTMCLSLSLLLVGSFAHAQVLSDEAPDPILPKLQVPIPGLTFEGSVIVTGSEPVDGCDPNEICVSVIGRYLNAVFRYGLGAGILFTIVLIMIGGVEWMTGAAISSIERGKQRIKNAALGLLFLLTVTTFLTFLNPAITGLNTLRVSTVKKAPGLPAELLSGNSTITTDIQNSEGEIVRAASIDAVIDPNTGESVRHPNIDLRRGAGVEMVHEDMVQPLHHVANKMNEITNGKHGIEVIAGFADPRQTMRRFYEVCIKGGGTCTELVCNPLPDSLGLIEGDYQSGFALTSQAKEIQERNNWEEETQLVAFLAAKAAENDERTCPYETGYAVGVICSNDNERKITDLRCQVQLEEEMRSIGFCRSHLAPWHYELLGKQTSVPQCNWIPGTMLRSSCSNPSGEEVDYSSADSSPCAVNYADLIGSCLQFDLGTGRCLHSNQDALNDAVGP